MPTNLPSSFASAAAGQNANRDTRAGSRDGRGTGGDWTRREGKPSNGTLTFRRSSSAQATSQAAASEPAMAPSPEATSTPQPMPPAEGARYSRDDILGLFDSSGDVSSRPEVAHLFMAGWNPGSNQGQVNGHSGHSWGKPSDTQPPKDLDSCWNPSGDTKPMAMIDMTAEEREMFMTDVNAPLKQHAQNKEGGQGTGPNGRKASMSHGTPTQYGLSSPTSTRPGTRRRESIDPSPFSASLASPTASRFGRDDSSYWFGRKAADKEHDAGEEEQGASGQNRDTQPRTPFGLPRTTTSASASTSAGGIGSLWANQTAVPSSATSGIGAFGSFALPTPSSASKQFGAGKGESRLARLIPQESSENMGAKAAAESSNADAARSWRPRPRTDTDPFGEDTIGGSALLGGIRDTSPPPLPKPAGQGAYDTPVKGGPGDLGMSGLHLSEQDSGPLSPSGTNPYGSPAERPDNDAHGHEGDDFDKFRAAADPSHLANATGTRGYGSAAFDGSDRSQTSSAGPRAYPSLNTYGVWPSGGVGPVGTPDRERAGFPSAFGSTIFSPMADPQSAGLGFGGGVFGGQVPVGSTPSIGRGSKLGSLFPAQMQAQMQSQEHDALGDSVPDLQQGNPLGAIGRGSIGHGRDAGAPLRTGQGVLEEVFGSADAARSRNMGFSTPDPQPAISSTAQGQAFTATAPGASFPSGSQGQADPPTAQVRTMVMPDRMRWVYLDPQGQTQGPFTGLEMNDWYKANFFTPDLRVKKVEDKEFEPLGQLIRRIGNSREPFLVPQIGIPHGPPAPSGPFSPAGGNAVPPLSGVFPSFGRTLTAEEQNNLERRKQEEQLMMAQQREAYMRLHQQTSFRPLGHGGVLHHHSSAHSLQSQPSFGSISSPIGMPPQTAPIGTAPSVPPVAAVGGYFDTPSMVQAQAHAQVQAPSQAHGAGPIGSSSAPGGDMFREDDLANLSTSERQVLASLQDSGAMSGPGLGEGFHNEAGASGVRTQLPTTEQLSQDPQGFRERLMQFEEIRAQRDAEEAAAAASVTSGGQTEEHEGAPVSMPPLRGRQMSKDSSRAEVHDREGRPDSSSGAAQKMAATTTTTTTAQSSGLPMPFPPPEQYGDEVSEERSPSPPAQPPPTAPWAKETEAHRKGPSLKEIQEAEARKAAKAEQAAQAARRAALEQATAELREKEKAAGAAAPGLPTSSTWGQHSPVNAASPWTKPAAGKASGAAAAPQAQGEKKRKTLAEIQREEEARKQKAKESSMSNVSASSASSAGKRYADLASKPNPPPLTHSNTSVAAGGGWATVGAGGKVKIPTGPASQGRSVSSGNVKLASAKPAATKPSAAAPSASGAAKSDSGNAAVEEFKKWLHRELSRGITVNNIDDFASTLMLLPLEVDTIADAVYANSNTMHGRHFAEEFIRRKKLADKGVVEKQPSATDSKAGSSSGGWNEVAKKGGHAAKDQGSGDAMAGAGFKVVPGRKKGKK